MDNYYSGKGSRYIRNHFPHHIMNDYLRIENKYIREIGDREFWDNLPDRLKNHYVENAEKYLDYEWKSIPAYDTYMGFYEKGNRDDALAFEMKTVLGLLATAECIQNKGRYLPQIVNGIFSIAEQTTWAGAAHLINCGEAKERLPEYDDVVLDLRAAETAVLFSYVYGSLKKKLDEISPVICGRIVYEVNRRMLKPYLEKDSYWWMCFGIDLSYWNVNNWNAHMNKCVIYCALTLCDNKRECYKILNKAIDSLDVFVDSYPDDGSCNEGPRYWNMAGGNLSYALDLLDHAMYEKSNIFKNSKIRNMMDYVLDMRIAGNYFASVADAHGKEVGNPYILFNIGEMFDEESFRNEARIMFRFSQKCLPSDFEPIRDFVCMRDYKALTEYTDLVDKGKLNAWMEGIQLLISRETEERDKGLYMCVKGGHNGESHNHNDIGSIIVYKDGKPIMIDVGIGTYTKDTFGENRYTKVWPTNGYHHNIPVINGIAQREGSRFTASDVKCTLSEQVDRLSLQLKDAYDIQDKIHDLTRNVVLDRTRSVIEMTDEFDFDKEMSFESILMLQNKPEIVCQKVAKPETFQETVIEQRTEILFPECRITVETLQPVEFEVEEILLEDGALSGVWGDRIYRLVVKQQDVKIGRISYVIK